MNRELGVPLEQLEPVYASDATEQAIADWHYWLEPDFSCDRFPAPY